MIKNSLKNFGKNLVFVFIPMGIFYMFLLAAVWIFAELGIDDARASIHEMGALLGNAVQDASLKEFCSYAVSQINWGGSFLETLRSIIDTHWVQNTITGFVQTISQTTEGFEEELGQIISCFANRIMSDVAVAVCIAAAGLLAANFATRFALRTRVAQKSFKQFVIAHTLVPLFETLLLMASLALLATIKLYSLLVFVAFLVLMCITSLSTSYLIYRDGTLKLKDVLTGRNVLQHLASVAIIAAIDIALALALAYLNSLFALLLIIPVVIYSANIVDVNTDSYVRNMVQANAEE